MLILGIETAGPTACAALMKDGILLAEHAIHNTRTHSETVMPMAEQLLAELDIIPADINAIAVNCGPGSFTGVRIGVCAANAMGEALGIPVIGVDSLSALHENVSFWQGNVCAIVDAHNDSAYMAQYFGGIQTAPPVAEYVDAYLPDVPAGTLFVGDGADVYADLIRSHVQNAVFAPAAFHLSRASALCRAAEPILASGADAPMQAAPLYLRPSQAERMWSKRHEQND